MATAQTIENMPPAMTGRANTAGMTPVAPGDDYAFHALLFPNRSLSASGFCSILTLVIGINLFNAVIYFALGAWPVMFFCGIDIAFVWLAFHLSYKQGRRHERVILTDEALWISRVLPSGLETRWKLQAPFVRVNIDRPVAHESQLCLSSHGRTLIIGSFLSPKERGTLAAALQAALAKVRV